MRAVTQSPGSVCKPHSVAGDMLRTPGRSSLWADVYHAPRAAYPELWPANSQETSSLPAARRRCPCLALLPAGVTWPPALLRTPVVSYTTFSPSPSSQSDAAAVCFCGPFRQVAPPRVLPDAVLYGVRTFLDPDNAGPRSPDRPWIKR